jgi:hypothetical protein
MTVEDAARRYVDAWARLVDADTASVVSAHVELDDAFHALVGALGVTCPMCDVGECPYLVEDGGACRECGCTDDDACWPPCFWVEPDLCSRCAGVDYAGVEKVSDPAGLLNEPTAS